MEQIEVQMTHSLSSMLQQTNFTDDRNQLKLCLKFIGIQLLFLESSKSFKVAIFSIIQNLIM